MNLLARIFGKSDKKEFPKQVLYTTGAETSIRQSVFHIPNSTKIMSLAKKNGWTLIDHQPFNKMVSFEKLGDRLNIYYTTWTVATIIKHPTRGKEQLFRKHCTVDMIRQIFENPRVHTGKGYFKK